MRMRYAIPLAMVLAGTTAGYGQKHVSTRNMDWSAQRPMLVEAERRFVNAAAQGGIAEVMMGNLAVHNAESNTVREFGRRMVADHGRANRELLTIVSRRQHMIPTAIARKRRAMINHLQSLTGAEFDRAYMHHMVEDHKADVAAFVRQARKGQDPEIRRWTARLLPTLRSHLNMATRIYLSLIARYDG